jgi:hypothetical protein
MDDTVTDEISKAVTEKEIIFIFLVDNEQH